MGRVIERESIRIETASRWDALDLVRRLSGYSLHLVQLSDSRWHVCVRQDRDPDQLLDDVLVAATSWASHRGADSLLHVGGRSYALHP